MLISTALFCPLMLKRIAQGSFSKELRIHLVFFVIRFAMTLLMYIGKSKKISIFTQFVPHIWFFSYVTEFSVLHQSDFCTNFMLHYGFYEFLGIFGTLMYYFICLATNYHYLLNVFIISPVYMTLQIYSQIEKSSLISKQMGVS